MTPARMLHQLGILFGMASTIHSSPSYHQPGLAPSSHHLFARETSSCQDIQSSFPSTFKCSSDKYCISTDDASTALCCAAGNNCTQIAPITCDIQKQNASVVPNSLIFTTRLRDSLPKCGDKCCPFGFECTPDPNTAFCQIILDKSSLSGAVVDGSKLSASSTSSATSSAASATDSSSLDSSQSLPKASHNPFPPTVFLAGLLPGLVIGILLTLAWVIYTKRNKKPDSPRTSSSSFSDRRPIISAPIPVENSTRTDFIRRAANKTKSVFSVRTDERVDSNPWNVKMPTPPVDNNIPRQIPGIPVTPVNQTAAYRKPSVETIQVYSPPSLIQHPSAVVPPLRRTAGQRNVSDAGLGQPFQTPPKSNQATGYEMSGASLGEILTPSRYSGAGQGPSDSRYEDKRDTTFTQMMAYCNMPDKGDSFPVPKVPEQYNSKNMI